MRDITEGIQIESPHLIKPENIRQLDPLGMNALFTNGTISTLNQYKDIDTLTKVLLLVLPSEESINQFTDAEVHAVVRDLGILIGSIARYVDPFEHVPVLQERLSFLAAKRDMSPYHTVFDYGLWNPEGTHRRRFTDTCQELEFIESVESGMQSLLSCLAIIYPLFSDPIITPEKIDNAFTSVRQAFLPMVHAIPVVMRNVGAEFFAHHMRPFFNSIQFNGESYDAPGGAQMPLLLLDHMIWGCDSQDQQYIDFRERNLKYLPREMADFVRQTVGMPSLVTRYLQEKQLKESKGNGLYSFLATLVAFRKPHEKLAKDSFHHRDFGAVGSGGYAPDILTHLADLTFHQMNLVRRQII